MKFLKIILIILIVGATSCKKTFLDLEPYNALPVSNATSSEGNLYTALNGLYASLRNTDLFGRMIGIKGDLMGDNTWIKLSNSGRFLDFNDYNLTVANANAANLWAAAYIAVKNANTVINSTLTANTNVSQMRGEAYAVRALTYFYLMLNYAKPFTIDANGLGVPIITSFDQSELPTRNKSSEVYKLIVDDLNQAYSLMTLNFNSSMAIGGTNITRTINTSYLTKYGAKALLAKVYMHMGDWTNAKAAALDVINNSGVTLVANSAYVNYWKNPAPLTSKVETLFEVTNDISNNTGTNALAYMYDQSGYGDILATSDIINKYTATDVRLQLIIPQSFGYVINKYSNTNNTTDRDDIKILRYSDVLLILAEAYARTNDEPNALLKLNQLAKNRDPSFVGYSSTGQSLIDDIINERRKELAFEGDRFFDLNRLNLAFNKVRREGPLTLIPVASGDFKRIFPIPTTETDVNPNIRSQQNPGY